MANFFRSIAQAFSFGRSPNESSQIRRPNSFPRQSPGGTQTSPALAGQLSWETQAAYIALLQKIHHVMQTNEIGCQCKCQQAAKQTKKKPRGERRKIRGTQTEPSQFPSRPQGPHPPRNTLRDAVLEGRISKKWSETTRQRKIQRGLDNRGNDCYRISLLICLFHCPEFYDYLKKLEHGDGCVFGGPASCVICALRALCTEYWNTVTGGGGKSVEGKFFGWTQFNNVLENHFPSDHQFAQDLKSKKQSDAFEFMTVLFEQLEEIEQALGDDPITLYDLFAMHIETRWTCNNCNRDHIREDTPMKAIQVHLHPEVPKDSKDYPQRLVDFVELDFKEEVEIACDSETCKDQDQNLDKKRQRKKVITSPPEILVLHLISMKQGPNPKTGVFESRLAPANMIYDEFLDLGRFTDEGLPLVYQLTGVVAHSGRSLNRGHYITGVREEDGQTFCRINDERVEEESKDPALITKLATPRKNSQEAGWLPYLLFYTKVSSF